MSKYPNIDKLGLQRYITDSYGYHGENIVDADDLEPKLAELSGKVEQFEKDNAKLVELLSDAYEEGWYYPEMYKDNKDPDFDKSSTKQKLEKIMKGEV